MHSRDFRSVWQWVYEAGQVKCVPLVSDAPCRGPHCQLKNDLPLKKLIVPIDQYRQSRYCISASSDDATHSSDSTRTRQLEDERAQSGYPRRLDEPPRPLA